MQLGFDLLTLRLFVLQDTRTHVVVEIYDTERSYVESLQILVMVSAHDCVCVCVCEGEWRRWHYTASHGWLAGGTYRVKLIYSINEGVQSVKRLICSEKFDSWLGCTCSPLHSVQTGSEHGIASYWMVWGNILWGVKAAGARCWPLGLHLMRSLRMCGAVPPRLQCTFTVWCLSTEERVFKKEY
jgi:hypothetical protein